MTPKAARAYATEWLAAWNSHDLNRILAHYAEDVVFRSDKATEITGQPVVRGKTDLRAYWRKGLSLQPDLKFELLDTYAGPGTLTLRYRNQTGREVCEVLMFDEAGQVVSGAACALVP
jgi:ketosteroid isomerase-like protein